ncbi:fibroblast growth factor 8-like isoform X2 [Gigantopelta aegis]|uniref:fibroblast growth factor 8-like isoform X2 n=1 Tax=Gigantopelta aegis TaxID=1735272 RepID=UPI001B888DD4|nr:fibroblast growth factor 8-like isoform X2 [Gigantopelta aegis]
MRKGLLQLDSSRCRLLTLLLILLLGFLGANGASSVHVSSSANPDFLKSIKKDSIIPTGGVSYDRIYQVYSRCSGKLVQIFRVLRRGRKGRRGRFRARVDAQGNETDNNTLLMFESHPSGGGHIYIKGVNSKKYLCFNRKGNLILRHYSDPMKCVFKEIPTKDNYTRLQFVLHPAWYVGFSRRGRRLKGFAIRHPRKQKCFHLLPKPWRPPARHRTYGKPFSPLDRLLDRNKLKHILGRVNR